jgi:hypothetical protein
MKQRAADGWTPARPGRTFSGQADSERSGFVARQMETVARYYYEPDITLLLQHAEIQIHPRRLSRGDRLDGTRLIPQCHKEGQRGVVGVIRLPCHVLPPAHRCPGRWLPRQADLRSSCGGVRLVDRPPTPAQSEGGPAVRKWDRAANGASHLRLRDLARRHHAERPNIEKAASDHVVILVQHMMPSFAFTMTLAT